MTGDPSWYYRPNGWYQVNHPCPSCGHCPTCGRGGYMGPYPTYPYPVWVSIPHVYVGDTQIGSGTTNIPSPTSWTIRNQSVTS